MATKEITTTPQLTEQEAEDAIRAAIRQMLSDGKIRKSSPDGLIELARVN